MLKKEVFAKVVSEDRELNTGNLVTEYFFVTEGDESFYDIEKTFVGKRIKITIEELE